MTMILTHDLANIIYAPYQYMESILWTYHMEHMIIFELSFGLIELNSVNSANAKLNTAVTIFQSC